MTKKSKNLSEFPPKSEWGDGPWQIEPDQDVWFDDATGYQCLIKRSMATGSLCGYVGVTKDHPAFGLHYDGVDDEEMTHYMEEMQKYMHENANLPIDIRMENFTLTRPTIKIDVGRAIADIRVHGGLTFSGHWEDENIWWFGFDCCHAWDICPAMEATLQKISPLRDARGTRLKNSSYKTIEFVRKEITSLAKQLKKAIPLRVIEGGLKNAS